MFVSKCFVVSFGLFFGLVAAAPIELPSEQLVKRGPTNAVKPNHMAQAVKVANKIRTNLKTDPDKAVFWSGTRQGKKGPVSVKDDAARFAKQEGKETINMALKKSNIKIPTEQQNPHSTRLWDFASKVWAKEAEGETHAVLGGTVRPASVYNKIEKPELLKNDKVTKLTEHNVDTKGKTVVKGGK
ncbi:unnamed protein product [Cyclocybe aegerita]|uniref:Uncharacterized protein n=1 Tax=Cyclocybe aegerita TaxID=1973307 RepID=A0A8S0W6C8_CYCAE|nr:unnamed protein product [Cyclocybe aegerita]